MFIVEVEEEKKNIFRHQHQSPTPGWAVCRSVWQTLISASPFTLSSVPRWLTQGAPSLTIYIYTCTHRHAHTQRCAFKTSVQHLHWDQQSTCGAIVTGNGNFIQVNSRSDGPGSHPGDTSQPKSHVNTSLGNQIKKSLVCSLLVLSLLFIYLTVKNVTWRAFSRIKKILLSCYH